MKLLTPGPVELSQETLRECGRQVVNHRSQEFREVLSSLSSKMSEVIGFDGNSLVLTGSGTLGVEFLAANCIERGDKVVCLSNGVFGSRFAEACRVYSDNCVDVYSEIGSRLEFDGCSAVGVDVFDADVVTMVLCETSAGVLNDVRKVRAAFPNALLLVDAVSGLGNPLHFEEMGIDGVAVASHKALAAPPGLCFAALSEKAREKALRKQRVPCYLRFEKYGKALVKKETPFTPCVQAVFAAEFRCRKVLEEGIENFVRRHFENGAFVRKEFERLGLRLVAKEWSVPCNIVTGALHAHADEIVTKMREDGFVLARGQSSLEGKAFRLAHMGETTRGELVNATSALSRALAV